MQSALGRTYILCAVCPGQDVNTMCGLPSCHKNTVSSVPAKYSVLSMRLTSRCNLRVCSMLQSRPHIKFACGRGQVMKLDVHCEKKKRSCHFVEDQKITKQVPCPLFLLEASSQRLRCHKVTLSL